MQQDTYDTQNDYFDLDSELQALSDTIGKGQSGAIILPQNPNVDSTAAAAALYLGLTKLGKNITLASEAELSHDLIGTDKAQTELTTPGDSLVISFPYSDGAIDKVDYNIVGDTFNLIIAPKPGEPRLQPENINYTYSGGEADFYICIDGPSLESFGSIYTENEEKFQNKPIIVIDRHLVNNNYGTVNYVVKTASSTCELVLQVLHAIGCELDRDIATNLYAGISSATNGFSSYSVNAETFESIAYLLRAGAVKKNIQKTQAPAAKNGQAPQNQQARQSQQPRQPQQQQGKPKQNREQKGFTPRPQVQNQARKPQQPLPPKPEQTQNLEALDYDNDEIVDQDEFAQPQPIVQEPDAPNNDDWLRPKIFGGNGIV